MESTEGVEAPLGIGGWQIQDDGWVSIPIEEGSEVSLHVRVQPEESGRFVVTAMLLDAPQITATLLREVQPARIEATFNLFKGSRGTVSHAMAADVLGISRSDEGLTLGELRSRTPVLPPEAAEQEIPQLMRPDGTDPEAFYRQVADAYRSTAAKSGRPAVELAEAADVPVTTVHRWIREARRRGFLPPAQKGRAG